MTKLRIVLHITLGIFRVSDCSDSPERDYAWKLPRRCAIPTGRYTYFQPPELPREDCKRKARAERRSDSTGAQQRPLHKISHFAIFVSV